MGNINIHFQLKVPLLFIFFYLISISIECSAIDYGSDIKKDFLTPGVSSSLANWRKENYKEVQYVIHFNIPEKKQDSVTGRVKICINLDRKQPFIIDFRADKSQIKEVKIDTTPVPYKAEDEHIIVASKYLKRGTNTIDIKFTAADQSLNRRDEFLYTLLVPDRARTLFPCFDQPDLKGVFTLSLDLPKNWVAVSNSAITEQTETTTHFAPTEPLSTYLFSFVAGKLICKTYTRDGRDISIYHRETDPKKIAQCPDIASEVFDAIKWQEEYTGIPYPFSKYDLIILPGFQYGGMEHTGATLYNDNKMFLNQAPTLNERLDRSSLIAHETAHMWYGDYVTMKWFDDVWTKEVFANYFASKIVQPLYPEINHRLNFILDYFPSAYSEDRTQGSNPIKQDLDNLSNAGLIYGNIIYTKSPIVMEMLVHIMGEEPFRSGIKDYLKTYAYGNATWDGLINILCKYTDEDLKTWSRVWINEKGMPQIDIEIKGDSLIVSQKDPWGRGLLYPQTIKFGIAQEQKIDTVSIKMGRDLSIQKVFIGSNKVLIPNIDGRAYGFFKIDSQQMDSLFKIMVQNSDEVARASILITLYENLLSGTIDPRDYLSSMLDHITKEDNPLLYKLSLRYIEYCQKHYAISSEKLEEVLWEEVCNRKSDQLRLQAFRSYRSVAQSVQAVERLYSFWEKQSAPDGCSLSENDYIGMSYMLAIRLPELADEIVSVQRGRISNPDRIMQYDFISPSVSPNKEVRDSVFRSLLTAQNRRIEPWAISALANLNDFHRQSEAIEYIRPALEEMEAIQKTGDIFFPRSWVGALIGGHTSKEAYIQIDEFFKAHPAYPQMLGNKIKQQADYLFRCFSTISPQR